MKNIYSLVKAGPDTSKNDDDISDRLSSRYSVLFLVIFTVVVSSQLYIGKPITCWCPKEFQGSWIKYTNNYCWVKNTYWLPFDEEIPRVHKGERERRELLYYQWLPFILLTQALFFYLPSVIWHAFNQKSGVDCDSILKVACKYQNTQKESGRKRLLRLIVNQMDRFLMAPSKEDNYSTDFKVRTMIRKVCCCLCSSSQGVYLVILYLFTKLVYVANVLGQLFLLNAVLRTNYSLYGYELIQNIIEDTHWVNSGSFPRVTMCDYTVRRLGNSHRYTVQCVLPINMYVEKIYAFLWVWMLFVAIISCLSFLQWLLRIIFGQDKYRYIRGHLKYAKQHEVFDVSLDYERKKHMVADFVDTYLHHDGVFVLRLIGHNTNNLTVNDVIAALWGNWVATRQKKSDKSIDDVDGH